MANVLACELCGREVAVHESYVVRIEVFADPSIPELTAEEMASADFESALADAIQQTQGMSADELQDQVHRSFEYRICAGCQRRFLVNPLGKPRGTMQATLGRN